MATADYNGVQKAAILLITLGPERSADIFKHLKEEEIEELTLEIANTRSVSPQVKEDILNEFYQVCLAQPYIAEGGSWTGKSTGGYLQADCFLTGPPIRVRAEDRSESAFELYPG